jgi:hypothetical protein
MQVLQATIMVARGAMPTPTCNPHSMLPLQVQKIRVAAGTYKPTATPDDSTDDDRNKAFHFNKDLVLKGSYNPATNTQDFTNPSILSGDFNDDDVITGSGETLSITQNSENAYHVLITADLTAATQIEGFLITGGACEWFWLSFI